MRHASGQCFHSQPKRSSAKAKMKQSAPTKATLVHATQTHARLVPTSFELHTREQKIGGRGPTQGGLGPAVHNSFSVRPEAAAGCLSSNATSPAAQQTHATGLGRGRGWGTLAPCPGAGRARPGRGGASTLSRPPGSRSARHSNEIQSPGQARGLQKAPPVLRHPPPPTLPAPSTPSAPCSALAPLASMSDPSSEDVSVSYENQRNDTDQVKSFISGGFGGVAAVLVGQPFDLTKTRLQTAPPGTYTGGLDVVKKTVAADGVRGCVLAPSPTRARPLLTDSQKVCTAGCFLRYWV